MRTEQAKRLKDLEKENARLKRLLADAELDKLTPSRKRQCIDRACEKLGVSQRRACRVLKQHRSTQWRTPKKLDDE